MSNQEFVDFEVDGLDLTDVKPWDGEFKLVDQGTYVVEVTGVDQDQTETTNKPYIEVQFTITPDQETEQAAAFAGQKLWGRYFLTDKAKGRLVSLMMACGAPLDRFKASNIYGAKLLIDVVHNQGEQKSDENGNPLPVRTFANVQKERAIEGAAQVQQSAPPPPAAKAAAKPAAKPAANGQAQARRA